MARVTLNCHVMYKKGGYQMLKLYYSPGACSLAPHIVLEEIREPFDIELVSLMDGSTSTAEYLKINPKGRVPVLDIGESVITEVSAILTYLALTYPQSDLLENTPTGLARAIEWMNWLTSIHSSIIAQNWRVERFSNNPSAHKDIQVKGMENLIEVCGQIDTKLRNLKWAVGEKYSIVDPYLLVFFRWGNLLGLDMKEFLHWTKHAKLVEQRKAVQSVLKVENISVWN